MHAVAVTYLLMADVCPAGLGDVASSVLSCKADKKNKNKTAVTSSSVTSSQSVTESAGAGFQSIKVMLAFKRNIFDPSKQMLQ